MWRNLVLWGVEGVVSNGLLSLGIFLIATGNTSIGIAVW